MPHVLIAGKLHPSGLELIRGAAGVSFDYVEEITEAAYLPLIGAADGLVIRTQPLRATTIAGAVRLRIVSRHGVGLDAVDVAALSARGIPLTIVGDVNARSVAEHAMMLILAGSKRLPAADRAVRRGDWELRNRLAPREIFTKRLLILGYGRIGRHLARMAAGFGMEIEAFDPFLEPGDLAGEPARLVDDLWAALAGADYVSVHVPKGEGPLLGAVEIGRMKPGAMLVNTARGGVVNETALVEALASGRLAAAGLDVFAAEPPAAGDPLLARDDVLLTPHVAGLTVEAAERMAVVSVRNVLDFFAGRLDPTLVVNRVAPADVGR